MKESVEERLSQLEKRVSELEKYRESPQELAEAVIPGKVSQFPPIYLFETRKPKK